MPGAITNVSQGMPVEIGRIDRELKQLWQEGESAMTRASLMNFAVYCEGADSISQTTEVIAQLTRDHACRAIVIGLDPGTPGADVQAWISAHCHLSRAGEKHVCCEQITFLLGRDGQSLIPNILFSHLDSDLPLALWWRTDLPQVADDQLWTWVDRLLYDSQTWLEPRRELELLRASIVPSAPRMILCDLNWTRSLYLRQALAQLFDQPDCLAELKQIDSIEITHAPGMRSTALLLAGWLAAQLKWTTVEGDALRFRGIDAREVAVLFQAETGPPLGGIKLSSAQSTFVVAHHPDSAFLHADLHLPHRPDLHYLLPGGKDDLVALLNEELMSGGKHRVYLKAAAAITSHL